MEREASSNNTGCGGDDITAAKEMRQALESRIEEGHKEQEELIWSLQTLNIPDLFSSLNLSLQLLSSLHRRPFRPLTPHPLSSHPNHLLKLKPHSHDDPHPRPPPSKKRLTHPNDSARRSDADPLSVVRALVAVCLLERVPFTATDSSSVLRKLENDSSITAAEKASLREAGGEDGAIASVEKALRAMAEENGGVELEELVVSGKKAVMVMGIDRSRLLRELPESKSGQRQQLVLVDSPDSPARGAGGGRGMMVGTPLRPHMGMPMPMGMAMGQHYPGGYEESSVKQDDEGLKEVEALLQKRSVKEMEKEKTGSELHAILFKATHREQLIASRFKTKGGPQLQEYCLALTKEDCRHKTGSFMACDKVHFRRIIAPHTDVNLGDCSFLDTCRHMKTCKYVHYELDPTPDVPPTMMCTIAPPKPLKTQRAEYCSEVELGEAQWINCDIRNFRMDILGQFGVIMADPPWDIHMELPYGTMADDEMRTLNVPALQTDGLIFLWVTGRAMELGRECLELWGYKRVEEIIWVKTNQLQRIIRTGRTGHWLNHSKEHCLVGIKGDPLVNRNIDTDVIVAEVRETSRKPDEMYPLLERISPRTRKLELFARMHNTQSGWLSLGNQLGGVRLVDDGLRARFKAAYPDIEVQPASPPRSSAMEVEPGASEVRTPFSGADAKPRPSQAPAVSETLPSQDVKVVS